MEIVSLKFTILSIVSIFVYYLLNHKYRAGFLAVLSCGFIATYSYILLIYIIIYAIFNYFIGLSLQGLKHKKAIFTFGIIINLTQLIILRYASFTIDPFIALLMATSMSAILPDHFTNRHILFYFQESAT